MSGAADALSHTNEPRDRKKPVCLHLCVMVLGRLRLIYVCPNFPRLQGYNLARVRVPN
ncbi:hypothetical protein PspLS_08565 [Pyricularia sp. CBS 133598]|nr:hypothetical protein PspLS_08565 [Pyricularia sp. CBS 133598]